MATVVQFVYPESAGIRPEDMPTTAESPSPIAGDQIQLIFHEGNDRWEPARTADELFEHMIDQAERAIIAHYESLAITE